MESLDRRRSNGTHSLKTRSRVTLVFLFIQEICPRVGNTDTNEPVGVCNLSFLGSQGSDLSQNGLTNMEMETK